MTEIKCYEKSCRYHNGDNCTLSSIAIININKTKKEPSCNSFWERPKTDRRQVLIGDENIL